jgi:azurin
MKYLSKLCMLLTVAVLLSCGDNKKEEEEKFTIGDQETTQSARTTTTETVADGEVVEIRLTGDDQMRFDKNELRVRAGQTVRLTFEHVGKMAKNVMGHNFVLLTRGTDINEFGQKAVAAADNDYIPRNTDQVIAHTKMLGGGETTTIEFTAPEPGTYDFICSFPGHYAIMRGKLIVQ